MVAGFDPATFFPFARYNRRFTMWLFYTPNSGWRVVDTEKMSFLSSWAMAHCRSLRWQVRYLDV
jgi:hypothetical protein